MVGWSITENNLKEKVSGEVEMEDNLLILGTHQVCMEPLPDKMVLGDVEEELVYMTW